MLLANGRYTQQTVAEKESQCTWYILAPQYRQRDGLNLAISDDHGVKYMHISNRFSMLICTLLSFVVVLLSSRVNNMSYSLPSFCSLAVAAAVRPTLIGHPSSPTYVCNVIASLNASPYARTYPMLSRQKAYVHKKGTTHNGTSRVTFILKSSVYTGQLACRL